MEAILKLIPRQDKRPAGQGQRILPFLSMAPSIQRISSTLGEVLAGMVTIACLSFKALTITQDGEGLKDGK